MHEEHALVHIMSHEWLEAFWYAAEYSTPTTTVQGTFMAHSYKIENDMYLFEGTFTTDKLLAP
jgi:hypothetical protein